MKKLFVIGCAALLLVAFTAPAMAKVHVGGIVFTDFYYLDRDKENAASLGLTTSGPSADPYTVTTIEVPSITRLYARWTNEDNVGMYIEYGLGGEKGSTAVSMRHGYGWWDVTPMFQIMAGHSTTPFSQLNPSQLLGTQSGTLNIIGLGYGDFYSGRFPQVRGTFRFGKVARLEIALVDPSGGQNLPNNVSGWQNNNKIPRIDVGVPIHLGPVKLYPSFLWQQKNFDQVPSGIDDSLTTYIGSLGVNAGFGPFAIAAEGNWGRNWGNTNGSMGNSPSAIGRNVAGYRMASATLMDNNKIHDAETYSFWFDASFKFGPVTPHLMYGQQKTKNKTYDQLSTDCKTQFWGFSVPIDLAKGFRLRPEFMWYDDGKTKTNGSDYNNGKYAIYGVQFQITF